MPPARHHDDARDQSDQSQRSTSTVEMLATKLARLAPPAGTLLDVRKWERRALESRLLRALLR